MNSPGLRRFPSTGRDPDYRKLNIDFTAQLAKTANIIGLFPEIIRPYVFFSIFPGFHERWWYVVMHYNWTQLFLTIDCNLLLANFCTYLLNFFFAGLLLVVSPMYQKALTRVSNTSVQWSKSDLIWMKNMVWTGKDDRYGYLSHQPIPRLSWFLERPDQLASWNRERPTKRASQSRTKSARYKLLFYPYYFHGTHSKHSSPGVDPLYWIADVVPLDLHTSSLWPGKIPRIHTRSSRRNWDGCSDRGAYESLATQDGQSRQFHQGVSACRWHCCRWVGLLILNLENHSI